MQKVFFILAYLLLLFSCKRKEAEYTIPDEFIQRDSMVLILADIHIAEARILSMNIGVNDKEKKTGYYKYVFQKHAVTPAEFKSSLNFYCANPELMNETYAEVINELSKRQAEEEK